MKSALTRALAIDGNHAGALAVLAFVQGLYERNWREAEATSARACRLAPDNTIVHHTRAVLAAYTGRIEEGLSSIEQAARLEPLALTRYVRPTYLAAVLAALGDHDRTFVALDRAIDEHDIHATSIVADPSFDSVREDRRFLRVVRRLGLDPRPLAGVGQEGRSKRRSTRRSSGVKSSYAANS